MNAIIEYNSNMFTEIEYSIAEELLKEIASEKNKQNDFVLTTEENQFFDENYPGSLANQPRYKNCEFQGTKFDGIDGLSSSILNCTFFSALFKDAGMNFSDFSGTHFLENTIISNCGYTGCNFTDVVFDNVKTEGSTFDRSFFIRTSIKNTTFVHCSFQDAVFDNVFISNSNLTQASLEFATFHNTIFKDTVLPFWGILKAFNGIQSVASQADQVRIKYSSTSVDFSVKKFLEMIEPLQAYFYRKKMYFVLANTNIYLGNKENAFRYTVEGLSDSLNKKDFRMIRNLCKLASNNLFFQKKDLRTIYDVLKSYSGIEKMNDHEYRIYLDEMDEIKRILIDNPYSMAQMTITFVTSFDNNTCEPLAALLQYIEASVNRHLPQCSYYFGIHRNSPPVIDIFISDSLPALYNFFVTLGFGFGILAGFEKGITSLKNIFQAKGIAIDNEIKQKMSDIELEGKKLENERMKLENERMQMENEKYSKELSVFLQKEQKVIPFPRNLEVNNDKKEHIESIGFCVRSAKSGDVPVRKYTVFRDSAS